MPARAIGRSSTWKTARGDTTRDEPVSPEQALAFRRAADLYGIALEYGAFDDAERRHLLRARAQALVNAGHLREA